jgi:hypothetical protein
MLYGPQIQKMWLNHIKVLQMIWIVDQIAWLQSVYVLIMCVVSWC